MYLYQSRSLGTSLLVSSIPSCLICGLWVEVLMESVCGLSKSWMNEKFFVLCLCGKASQLCSWRVSMKNLADRDFSVTCKTDCFYIVRCMKWVINKWREIVQTANWEKFEKCIKPVFRLLIFSNPGKFTKNSWYASVKFLTINMTHSFNPKGLHFGVFLLSQMKLVWNRH